MFTGIITAKGRIVSLAANDFGVRLIVDPGKPAAWPAFPREGDSIAVNGCCLTHAPIAADDANHLAFDVIKETLNKTSLGRLKHGGEVNLELSVTPTTAMGGHFVQGHIDGTGTITAIAATDEEWTITIQAPPPLAPYLVPKGSITVDGVSLTLAKIDPQAAAFTVALIPTTLRLTTLGQAKTGDIVNLECDMIAKTIVHHLKLYSGGKSTGITLDALKAAGFAE